MVNRVEYTTDEKEDKERELEDKEESYIESGGLKNQGLM